MFKSLSIKPCVDITLRQLIELKNQGHSVYRTSHAGNWNLYKLILSELGLPDCIWDVTCMHKDVNNQPKYQLVDGKKVTLIGQGAYRIPTLGEKHLTPYHKPENCPDETLSSFHVRPLRQLFPGVITTQSEELLEYKDNLVIIFDIVERYYPQWLGRFVLPCGCMVEIKSRFSARYAECVHSRVEIKPNTLRESAINTLEELKKLVLDPSGYTPCGGVVYSFELVVACYYLWCHWKFGDKAVYQLSGPDMIGYATKPDFIRKVGDVLRSIGDHAPQLVPGHVDAKIVPATFMRFGYVKGDSVSESVMNAHCKVVELQERKRQNKGSVEVVREADAVLKEVIPIIDQYGSSWDLFHDPAKDAFYSQHDMARTGGRVRVMDGFLDVSFRTMGEILRTLPQIEASLRKKFLREVSQGQPIMEDSFR
ncbi:MAG: hypothetical protein NTV02_03655 [Candidatus Zambryskibacteria bacterium]|nr:hypothetical protein [Candidatus Zambryskibacteria bacterium]